MNTNSNRPIDGALTVLVIDDSEIAREEMRRVLAEAGMRVVCLNSPIGATRAILDNNAQVVVIDIQMPGMRGDRLAGLFRGNPRFAELGVVLVSGEADIDLQELSLAVGADAVVSKLHLEQLVVAVLRAQRARGAPKSTRNA